MSIYKAKQTLSMEVNQSLGKKQRSKSLNNLTFLFMDDNKHYKLVSFQLHSTDSINVKRWKLHRLSDFQISAAPCRSGC